MEPRKYKYDVFISYSRRDYTLDNNEPNPDSIVSRLLDAMDAAGLSYWIDKEGIYTGDEFQEVICTAIEESRVFLFVSSIASNSSEWTPGEIQTAIDLKMPIVPFRIDDTIYNKKIRIRLSPIDRIDYFKLGDKSFNTLIASLQEHVGRVKDIENDELRKIEEQRRESEQKRRAEAERKRKYERIVAIIETINASIARSQADKKKRLAELEALGFPVPEHLQEPDSEEIIALKQQIAQLQQQLYRLSGQAEVPPPIPATVIPTPPAPEENERKREDKLLAFIKKHAALLPFVVMGLVVIGIFIFALFDSGSGCQRSGRYAHSDSTDVEKNYNDSTYIVVNPEEEVFEVAVDPYNGHEYVDLGLPSGILWATCNVGASSPEEFGDYFAWGETEPKERYNKANSKTYGKDMWDISGNPEYDAATANWGGEWRMPTEYEIEELIENTTYKFVTMGAGINGVMLRSKINGENILLPASGWRDDVIKEEVGDKITLWSSTPIFNDSNNKNYAVTFCFVRRPGGGSYFKTSRGYFPVGIPIRPVISGKGYFDEVPAAQ